ncbi:MAG: hypothetical protein BWZ08_01736 [candidate division BRC1 bacterium ADurb.BinA292]|nr:MAG: hypothetical protein BWZ08_01736 [candidate division BRC1 bacterium ADurb.BinA292]
MTAIPLQIERQDREVDVARFDRRKAPHLAPRFARGRLQRHQRVPPRQQDLGDAVARHVRGDHRRGVAVLRRLPPGRSANGRRDRRRRPRDQFVRLRQAVGRLAGRGLPQKRLAPLGRDELRPRTRPRVAVLAQRQLVPRRDKLPRIVHPRQRLESVRRQPADLQPIALGGPDPPFVRRLPAHQEQRRPVGRQPFNPPQKISGPLRDHAARPCVVNPHVPSVALRVAPDAVGHVDPAVSIKVANRRRQRLIPRPPLVGIIFLHQAAIPQHPRPLAQLNHLHVRIRLVGQDHQFVVRLFIQVHRFDEPVVAPAAAEFQLGDRLARPGIQRADLLMPLRDHLQHPVAVGVGHIRLGVGGQVDLALPEKSGVARPLAEVHQRDPAAGDIPLVILALQINQKLLAGGVGQQPLQPPVRDVRRLRMKVDPRQRGPVLRRHDHQLRWVARQQQFLPPVAVHVLGGQQAGVADRLGLPERFALGGLQREPATEQKQPLGPRIAHQVVNQDRADGARAQIVRGDRLRRRRDPPRLRLPPRAARVVQQRGPIRGADRLRDDDGTDQDQTGEPAWGKGQGHQLTPDQTRLGARAGSEGGGVSDPVRDAHSAAVVRSGPVHSSSNNASSAGTSPGSPGVIQM